ncbi:hypothetical protein RD055328_08330 [Companilactobacillus sp. RD055328]|uniref:hypothetical protein n=1 Tax=Companilactobacillus sp. RD055328 TaxID=2916634 RepID=UPI001FC8E3DE|nr:hypothetical protein [Companilactobacillus sp. RD055328]GKQ42910.1 hypothetical protein RD055328_08330 [Companilactobacillus sp. RD055328]
MYITALNDFNINDLKQIGMMSLEEYWLRFEAAQIKKVEETEKIAKQSWLNQSVQATKGSSKNPQPKFKQFEEFYNSIELKNKIHKNFIENYVPIAETKKEKEKTEQSETLRRFEEFQKMKKESS